VLEHDSGNWLTFPYYNVLIKGGLWGHRAALCWPLLDDGLLQIAQFTRLLRLARAPEAREARNIASVNARGGALRALRLSYGRVWCYLIGRFGHAFAGIIRRVHVSDCKRPVAVNLHNCPTVSPAKVAHASRYRTKTTRMEQHPFLYVESVAHADVEVTGNHRNGFILRMIVSGDFVVRGQPNNIRPVRCSVTRKDGELGSCRNVRWGRPPFYLICIDRRLHFLCERQPAYGCDCSTARQEQRLTSTSICALQPPSNVNGSD
jgi:hypothetical protein